MRGVVTPILGLLAVACMAVGVLNATVWKPDAVIAASASVRNARYVVSDPGVLNILDSDVQVTVRAADASQHVCLAVGSAKDAVGWVGSDAYTRITGLSDWKTLSVGSMLASDKQEQAEGEVAFQDADMWRSVTCGTQVVHAEVKQASADESLIVDAGEDPGRVTVSLRWHRQSVPDFATPLYIAAGLLMLLAVLAASVFAMEPHKRRRGGTTANVAPAQHRVAEDVGVWEALSGTVMAVCAVVTGGSRRHAKRAVGRHSGGASAVPKIVDPRHRNMVAERQADDAVREKGASDEVSDGNEQDVWQAYFARLQRESQPDGDMTTDVDDMRESEDAETVFETGDTDVAESTAEGSIEDSADEAAVDAVEEADADNNGFAAESTDDLINQSEAEAQSGAGTERGSDVDADAELDEQSDASSGKNDDVADGQDSSSDKHAEKGR